MYNGQLPVIMPEVGGNVEALLKVSDKFRRMGIRANADTPKDALIALGFGAEVSLFYFFSFLYRDKCVCESCSQFDLLPSYIFQKY